MDGRIQQFQEANERYLAGFGSRGELTSLPRQKTAIITCMDVRLFPMKALGLQEGDAQVLRNPGAQLSEEMVMSLLLTHRVFGCDLWLVMHHTDCGLYQLTEERLAELRKEGIEPILTSATAADAATRALEGARQLRSHPLVLDEITVQPAVYEVETGRIAFLK